MSDEKPERDVAVPGDAGGDTLAETNGTERMTRRRWFAMAQLVLGCILIVVLVAAAGKREVIRVLAGASWPCILAGVLIVLATYYLRAIALLLLIAPQVRIPAGQVFRINLIGGFFTNFLPSQAGGDMVSGLYLRRHFTTLGDAYAALLVQRGIGFLGTLLMVGAVAPFAASREIAAWMLGISIAALAMIALAIRYTRPDTDNGSARTTERPKLLQKATLFVSAVMAYRSKPKALVGNLLLSCAGTLMGSALFLAAACSVHSTLSIGSVLAGSVVSQASSVIPLTPGGVGVFEAAFAGTVILDGGAASQTLAIALVVRLITIVSGLLGGLVYLHGVQVDVAGKKRKGLL